jgi:hypothetical protein
MRHVPVILAASLLVIGCDQFGGEKPQVGSGEEGEVQVAARPSRELCGAVSGAIGQLDGYLNQLGQINLCLSGASSCATKDLAKKACEARDSLEDFHTSGGCTDQMLGNRPALCSRL